MPNVKDYMDMLNEEELSILRLIRSENIGPRTFFSLVKALGSAKNALEKARHFARRGGRDITVCSREQALKEVESTKEFGAEIICYTDERYPSLLKEITDFPPVITVKGKCDKFFLKDKVAIVGSRNASINGANFAHKIASELSTKYVVVSGLARGIDTYVHKGSLSRGTIAVIANGIDQIYPLENKKLYEEIIDSGVLITEQPFGALPQANYFPQRNRIISGLTLATIVIEAGVKSGSLITARLANEQGRDVFAVPGFPMDVRYSGTNYLLKQGAYLLERSDDVLNVLQQRDMFKSSKRQLYLDELGDTEEQNNYKKDNMDSPSAQKDLDKIHKLVLSKVSTTPVSLNQLIRGLDIPVKLLSIALIELELAGKVQRVSSNQVVLNV